jgi:surface antigen
MLPSALLFPRKRVLAIAVGLLFALVTDLAVAQSPLAGDLAWPGLTRDDIDRMHEAAARLYEGRSIGTVERWRSPDSRNAGEVRLIRGFEAHGMPCRLIDYTVRFEIYRNSPDHYVLTWCKIRNGEWKIVELAPRH